jgi:hypothetical protein
MTIAAHPVDICLINMKIKTCSNSKLFTAVAVGFWFSAAAAAPVFVGRLTATLTRAGQTQTFIYTAGTNTVRIERGETDWPHARNLVDRETGAVTLLFPHNRSFVRLKSEAWVLHAPSRVPADASTADVRREARQTAAGAGVLPTSHAGLPPGIGATNLPGMPAMPNMTAVGGMPALPGGLPSGIGPQSAGAPGAPAMAGMGGMAGGMPMMPQPPMEKAELKATGETTNLLGYACARYEIKQGGEVMVIWATDQLLPYEPWRQNQPPRFGPQMLEEQWGELVKAKKLFPLLAMLKIEHGPEHLHFEVKSVRPETIEDRDGALFQPPADYREIQPLPF